jgi:hypothetical protein
MGIHGSPTCVMRFDEARAWLVGDVGRGLNAMFIMMNAARLHVALQGVGLLDAAWQKADAYAHERRQMRAPRSKGASQNVAGEKGAAPADLIIEHPAMRRILDTQRAWVDGARVLAYETGLALDEAKHHPDTAQREAAQRWCALITPILKASCTDQGFHGASECLQVFGGHGYVSEWGIEQNVRDARIAMIYEGTNEIQAIDLLVRKIIPDGGNHLNQLLDDMKAASGTETSEASQLRQMTQTILLAAQQDPSLGHRVADDYLRAMALVLLQWAWQRIDAKLSADTPELKDRWHSPSKAFCQWVLPEFAMRKHIIETQCAAA